MGNTLIKELNGYLANVEVFYIKLHNLHWNVVGPSFKEVHEYLETLYNGFAVTLDEVAESIKMKGGYPLATLKEYLEVASIEELASKDYTTADTKKIVKEDLMALKKQVEAIRALAGEADDYAIVGMLEAQLTNYNKTIWFIDSMSK